MAVPSLLDLCLRKVASDIPFHSVHLHRISLELGDRLLRTFPYPRAETLRAFSWAFWRPVHLSLAGVHGIASSSLRHLNLFATCLAKLDLRGCDWVTDLQGLQGITGLECLNLRGCTHLGEGFLAQIQQLPNLHCLDLENVASFSDTHAAQYIPGMRALRALNVSGTAVGLATLEALTYGLRMKRWRQEERAARAAARAAEHEDLQVPYWERDPRQRRKRQRVLPTARLLPAEGEKEEQEEEEEMEARSLWPISRLVFIRLQNTAITGDAVELLCFLEDLQLIDLRHTKVTVPKVEPLQGRFQLARLPNEAKLLGRSNTALMAAMRGACGCTAMRRDAGATPSVADAIRVDKAKPDWVRDWEYHGALHLLWAATREEGRLLQRPVR